MELALIAPDSLLHYQGDIAFILAQRLKSDVYRKFYESCNLFKIVDHGSYEDEMIDDVLVNRPIANEIILPDILHKRGLTCESLYEIRMRLLPDEHVMVVPQGYTPYEWCTCCSEILSYYSKLPLQLTIGIPIWLEREYHMRSAIVKWLTTSCRFYRQSMRIHLLGLDCYYELLNYNNHVRSVDTSLPFSLAWNDIVHPFFEEPKEHRRVPYIAKFSDKQIENLERELSHLQSIIELTK